MIGHRSATARRGLPLRPDGSARLLPWVLALTVYLASLGGVGLILIDDALRAFAEALSTTLTLQVPADTTKARLETVLALLRQTPGIASVHLLEPAETARLLEPWLGPAAPLDELPVPRLIDLRSDPQRGLDLAALRAQLATVVPEARLDDQLPWPEGLRAAAHRIEGVLAALIVVALCLAAAASVLAARAALLGDRSAARLLHVLGAADREIARRFALRSLWLGLSGGMIGGAAALLTLVFIGDAGALVLPAAPGAANGLRGEGIADWRVWATLIGAALAAGLIAMASTWAAVTRRLALMP